jgi:hypothetical protein
MKQYDKTDEFPKDKIFEFLFFPIFIIFFLLGKILNIESINDNFTAYMFIALGLLNIFSSNILTYIFNLSYRALLIPFRLKPWFIKVFGVALVLNAIRILSFVN